VHDRILLHHAPALARIPPTGTSFHEIRPGAGAAGAIDDNVGVRPRPDSPTERPCPCGRGVPLAECCGPFLDGEPAPTAEALMRSRYTAFAVGDRSHLLRTWHPDRRPASLTLDEEVRWTGLEILHTGGGGFLHTAGTVEFRAHYVDAGVPGTLHEHSRFVRVDGRWSYLDDAGDTD